MKPKYVPFPDLHEHTERCDQVCEIVYLASEVDAVITQAIEFMNEGHYGLAAVTLSSAINPPTSEL